MTYDQQAATTPIQLGSADGFRVELLPLGAGIKSIIIPTPKGDLNAVTGYANSGEHSDNPAYMGVTVGRYANRLAGGRIRINGQSHAVSKTPEQLGHCLHGGAEGFSARCWEAQNIGQQDVSFFLVSPDGDQGFPGRLECRVTYTLLEPMTLAIKLTAVSNAATVVSLTNHAYFNLNHDNSTTDNHQITVNADRYLPIQTNMIPTGELRNVDGTPFDLRQPRTMGEQRTIPHPQLELTNGFDHNFVLNSINHGLVHAATLFSPQSGLQLECRTNQPGLQLYGGQHLTPPFLPRQGICLEPQQFPDAPNQPGFPSAQLEPGEIYEHRMVLSFSIRG